MLAGIVAFFTRINGSGDSKACRLLKKVVKYKSAMTRTSGAWKRPKRLTNTYKLAGRRFCWQPASLYVFIVSTEDQADNYSLPTQHAALYYILKSELQRAQVALHYATKGQIPDNADGVLSDGLDVLIAQIERLRIAERLQRGKRGKIEGAGGKPGQILGHGANAPYGYKYEGRKKERRLVVQEDEAAIVRNIFIWYTQERLSAGQITDRLTKLRVPTPADRGRKVAQRKRGAGQWSKSSVARILRCPTYTGIMYHFRYRRAKKSTNVTKRPEQDWVGVPVPVIIDTAIWQVTQRRLDEGRSLSKRNGKQNYLLGRRIRCQCGYAMFGTSDRWRRWYRCGGRNAHAVHHCDQKEVKADVIEPIVWEWIERQLRPEVLREGLEQQRAQSAERRLDIIDQIDILTLRHAIVEKERRQAIAAFQAGALSMEELRESKDLTDQTLRSIEAELARLHERLSDSGPTNEEIDILLLIAHELHAELAHLTFERQRKVIDLLDLRVWVETDADSSRWAHVTCRIATDRLLISKIVSRSNL